MKLIKFQERFSKDVYVNPEQVLYIRPNTEEYTYIFFGYINGTPTYEAIYLEVICNCDFVADLLMGYV